LRAERRSGRPNDLSQLLTLFEDGAQLENCLAGSLPRVAPVHPLLMFDDPLRDRAFPHRIGNVERKPRLAPHRVPEFRKTWLEVVSGHPRSNTPPSLLIDAPILVNQGKDCL
jgi:hypothetical protein